jgi:hypothetical protein
VTPLLQEGMPLPVLLLLLVMLQLLTLPAACLLEQLLVRL